VVVMRFIMNGQSVYVPIQHEVYDFLKRMEARQLLIEYKDAARPLSRIQIASAFLTLEKHVDEMTRVERETYEFLKTEFNYEILKISGDAEPSETRWHIYSRDLTEGVLNFDINYSLSQMSESSQSTSTRSQGFKTYGYVFNTVGFYFNIVDNLEKGDNVNYSRFNDGKIDELWFLSPVDKDYYKRIKNPFPRNHSVSSP